MACSAAFRVKAPEHTVRGWWHGLAGFGTMALVSHAPAIARAFLFLLRTAWHGAWSLVSPNLIIALVLLRFLAGELAWERDHGLGRMIAETPAGCPASGLTPKGRSRARGRVASRIYAIMGLGARRQLGSAAPAPAPPSRSGSLIICSSCGLPFRWLPGRACTVCGSQQARALWPGSMVVVSV